MPENRYDWCRQYYLQSPYREVLIGCDQSYTSDSTGISNVQLNRARLEDLRITYETFNYRTQYIYDTINTFSFFTDPAREKKPEVKRKKEGYTYRELFKIMEENKNV